MKKVISILAIVVCFAVGLCLSDVIQKNEKIETLQNACTLYIETALSDFISYQENTNADDYWKGTSAFYAYLTTYSLLKDEVDSHFLYCNELYSHLIADQTKIQKRIDILIPILELLKKDISDTNAAQKIFEMCNEISME